MGEIFRSYDIRGVYPDEINEDIAYRIGQAYLRFVKPSGTIAVGMDVRIHSPQIKNALIKGLLDGGADVLDIGLVSTEMLYFAVGYYNLSGGIQVTASHNPSEYNGFKIVREKAIPVSSVSGIFEIRDMVLSDEWKFENSKRGSLEEKDVLDDFANFILKFIDKSKIKPLKLTYNPSFGFQGVVLEKIKKVGMFPLELTGMNNTLDGNFPKGRPDPLRIENRPEFSEFTQRSEVDLGVAWDADGDRVFFCTKDGLFVEPYWTNAILSRYILEKNRGEKIIYDSRYTWALIDLARESGGEAIQEKAGRTFIQERMKKENAIFASEASGHTFFRDFWYSDSGIIPLLLILELISSKESLEKILDPITSKYFVSGEINFETENTSEIMEKAKQNYQGHATIVEIDGLSLESEKWRMNIRSSATEPLMRVNIEGKSQEIVNQKVSEITNIIKQSS